MPFCRRSPERQYTKPQPEAVGRSRVVWRQLRRPELLPAAARSRNTFEVSARDFFLSKQTGESDAQLPPVRGTCSDISVMEPLITLNQCAVFSGTTIKSPFATLRAEPPSMALPVRFSAFVRL